MTRFAVPFAFDASTIMAVGMTGDTQSYGDGSPWDASQSNRADAQTYDASTQSDPQDV